MDRSNTNINTNKNSLLEIGSSYLFKFQSNVSYKLLKECKVGFFIDVSLRANLIFHQMCGTYYEVERFFAKKIDDLLSGQRSFFKVNDYPRFVGTNIKDLSMTEYGSRNLKLSNIFKYNEFYNVVRIMDVMILITFTDYTSDYDIELFAYYMRKKALNLKAVILVFVERRTDNKGKIILKPSDIYSKMLKFVPIMNTNGCILFYNTKNIYVIWSNGCFKSNWNPVEFTMNSDEWKDNVFSQINFDHIANINLPFYDENTLNQLSENNYISIGPGMFLQPGLLINGNLKTQQIRYMLKIPFTNICTNFVLDYNINETIAWLNKQKKLLQQILNFLNSAPLLDQSEETLEKNVLNLLNTLNTMEIRIKNEFDMFTQRFMVQLENTLIDNGLLRYIPVPLNWSAITLNNNLDVQDEIQLFDDFNEVSHPVVNIDNVKVGIFKSIWKDIVKIVEKCEKVSTSIYDPRKNMANPHIVRCSICCDTRVPFILIRKHLRENELISCENVMEYCYNAVVCFNCTINCLVKGKDPARNAIHTALPLITLDNLKETKNEPSKLQSDEIKHKFVNHFVDNLIDESEINDVQNSSQKKLKVINIITTFIDKLIGKIGSTEFGLSNEEIVANNNKIEVLLENIKSKVVEYLKERDSLEL